MYNDYDVVYKSKLNEYLVVWSALGIISLILGILTLFALTKVYKKANRSGVAAWIPIYNFYLLVEIADLSKSYFFMLFVPFVNIYSMYKISLGVAKQFKKSEKFGLGLFLFPYLFYPILGFGDSEYVGINIAGIEGRYTVDAIPIIDENKNKEIEVQENASVDVASRNINISIGGGVYQKNYVENLQSIDQSKTIDKNVQAAEQNQINGNFINDELINEINIKQHDSSSQVEKVEKTSNMFNIKFIDNKNTNNSVVLNETIVPNVNEIETTPTNTDTINGVEIKNTANINIITPESTENVENKNINDIIFGKKNSNNEQNKNNTDPVDEVKKCPKCGTKVPNGAFVCFICGERIN